MCKVWTSNKSRFRLSLHSITVRVGEINLLAQGPAFIHLCYLSHILNSKPLSVWGLRCWWWESICITGLSRYRACLVVQGPPTARSNLCNLWWTSHLSMIRKEAALWELGLSEQNRKDVRKAGESTLGRGWKECDSLGEEKQLLSKQKCYQAQRLRELKKGNRSETQECVRACGALTQVNLCRSSPGSQDIQSVGQWGADSSLLISAWLCVFL